jgi:uncharacterized phage protein gp47/JayE
MNSNQLDTIQHGVNFINFVKNKANPKRASVTRSQIVAAVDGVKGFTEISVLTEQMMIDIAKQVDGKYNQAKRGDHKITF